jgi:bisphosphoglycerate-dependent phosphoglycerate mutase
MSVTQRDNFTCMPSPGSKKPYPTGRKQEMTATWKDRVRARLDELGHDHRWLEERIGAGRGQVTKMLAEKQQTSKMVDAVCRVLDLPPPSIASNDADEQELVRRFREMDNEGKRHVLGIVEMLTRDPHRSN